MASNMVPTGPVPPGPGPARWQNPQEDQASRQQMTQEIMQVFSKKKGNGLQNWGSRLHEFVRRLEQQLYTSARSKAEYMDLSTLELRLQAVARNMGNRSSNGPQQSMGNSNMQSGLPPGMVPNPGQAPSSHMPNASSGMQFQGQPNAMPSGPMPGFMPTPNLPQGYPAEDATMRGGVSNGAGPGAGSSPMDGGINGMVPTSNTYAGSGMVPNPMMRPNGQRDSGFMGGQLLNGNNNGVNSSQRMSMNGMQPGNMGNGMMPNPQPISQPPGFIPTASTSLPPVPPGMMPVNPGMPQPMMPMGGMPGPGPGSGMMPMGSGMMPVPGGPQFPGMHGGMPPMPPAQAQQNNIPPAPPGDLASMDPTNWGAPPGPGNTENMSDGQKSQYVQKQQRWLLFLRHCAKCRQNEAECQLQSQCKFGKQLWQHILHCANAACEYPRCTSSKDLLKHHQKCQSSNCPICAPVKEYVRKTRMQQQTLQAQQQNSGGAANGMPMAPNGMVPTNAMPGNVGSYPPQQGQQKRSHSMMNGYQQPGMGGMMPVPGGPPPQPPAPSQQYAVPGDDQLQKRARTNGESVISKNTGTSLLETFEATTIKLHKEGIYTAQTAARNAQAQLAVQPNPDDMCKVCGCVKLLYEPPVLYCSQCNLKIKRGQVYYCSPQDAGADYRGCWCHQCYTEAKDRIPLMGSEQGVKKSELTKHKNDTEIEEPWVQCDNCQGWVHQICGLFNKGRNKEDVHYLCPDCLVVGLEMGQRQRIEQRPQAMLEAKDLPHCELSKYLEQRLVMSLDHERQARAAKEGKYVQHVQTAEGLTVRVVNSLMKRCEVKPRFYDEFREEYGYAGEFPYRQRVVILFQNLDGVDVCLFCMYVQEYGEDCPAPNRNCVYLSYLDSVKYFRPELDAVNPNPVPGQPNQKVALRTYVYHQILIGYLAYVKMLGFEQMYIWACPPMQGDDYILYCHPNKQKTPKSDRLRFWYLDMLKQAKSEQIVIHISTLWDTYFPGGRDHRMEKCSATHIPYLEGDFWPGEAENQLSNIIDGQRQANKNSNAKGAAAAARKSGKGKRYGTADSDQLMMEKLGEILGGNMKEDFIVVHLQEVCTFCRTHIPGGQNIYRYHVQGAPKPAAQERKLFDGIPIKLEQGPNVPIAPVTSLQICERCWEEEAHRAKSGATLRLPPGVSPMQMQLERLEPTCKVKDPDGDVENEFFETRQSFLSLCQGNHYQFDTLRRAKHSSMMVLYHIHNPNAPAFASNCNVCSIEMDAGSGFRCTVCPDFDICQKCQATKPHEHPVVQQQARKYDETRMRLTEAERRERNEQLQKTMQLLVHACNCNNPQCGSNSCRKVRQLFQHAVVCQVKVTGGCQMCKKMWCLLNLHSKSCTRSDCPVPRCRELKELRRRQTARQEDKRRMAYAAMLRNQMAGQSGGS